MNGIFLQFFFSILVLQCQSCKSEKPKEKIQIKSLSTINDSIPLFIVGTYLHDQTSISIDAI